MPRDMMLTPTEYMALMRLIGSERESEGASIAPQSHNGADPPKKKRRVSAYQRRLGVEWRTLAKRHPRTAKTALLGRAHAATRKALGMKRKRR